MKNFTDNNKKLGFIHRSWKELVILIIALVCLSYVIILYRNDEKTIDIVMNGTSFAYPNKELTYGNVFSEYFDHCNWSTKNINDNQFVIFSGDVHDEDTGKTETIGMWFLISDDSYVIRNFTIDGCQVDMDTSYTVINNAFTEYMEKHGIDCAEVYSGYIN